VNLNILHRKGIASIIGGAFLILVILSGYAFYALSNNATNELQDVIRAMNRLEDERQQEKLSILITSESITIKNTGSELIAIRYIATTLGDNQQYYFNDMKQRESDVIDPLGTRYINPHHESTWDTSTFSQIINDIGDYRVIVITDRGSVTRYP
jgi:hypothetical protein